jgi:hypothetical protein
MLGKNGKQFNVRRVFEVIQDKNKISSGVVIV